MQYPETRYVRIDDIYLELYSWDGLYRGVVFRTATDADAAMHPSRAYFDVPAIEAGLLPKGANLVSGAASAIDETRLSGDSTDDNPVLLEERRVAVAVKAAASRYVTPERDAEARLKNPGVAMQYDRSIELLERDEARRVATMTSC